MLYRNLIIISSAFVNILAFQGCAANKNKVNSSPKDYDLNNPSVLYLNEVMAEISGIYFYQKDSSVFAISDESGYLFKIHLNKNFITQRWRFDKTHDFEDLFYRDNAFYILESNGDIHTFNFLRAAIPSLHKHLFFLKMEKVKMNLNPFITTAREKLL